MFFCLPDTGFFPFHLTSSTKSLPHNQDSTGSLWVHAESDLEIFLQLVTLHCPGYFRASRSTPPALLNSQTPQQLWMVFLIFPAVTWPNHFMSSPSLKSEKAQNRGLSLHALSHSIQPYPYHVPGLSLRDLKLLPAHVLEKVRTEESTGSRCKSRDRGAITSSCL